MGTEIEIDYEKENGILLVRLMGRLDITRAEEFENNITEKLQEKPMNMIINLSGVTYLSSSGVRSLMAIYRLAAKQYNRVFLCEASPAVNKVLEVVEIGQILKLFGSEADAIDAMK